MNNWKIKRTIDLSNASLEVVQPDKFLELMVPGDHQAHTIEITVMDGGVPADLTGYGSCAYFIRSNGSDYVRVTGSISDNVVSLTMASECYAYSGAMTCICRITKGTQVVSVSLFQFWVQRSIPAIPIAPGNPVQDIETLLEYIDQLEELRDDLSGYDTKLGNLNNLITPTKTNLVSAINEAYNHGGGGGGGTDDFDELSNRPKYAGTTMTHNTNIPEVKTAAWDGKENKGKITISGVEKTANTHTVTIVTDGQTTTMTFVGVS